MSHTMSLSNTSEDNIRDYDHLFKLLLLGDSGVGKSSLLLRFADDAFNDAHITTIGVDFRIRSVDVGGQSVKLQIWDTAGQERFRTITSSYYRGTHGVIVVYDVTSAESFANVKRWLNEIDSNCDAATNRVLVGNKTDSALELKEVHTKDAQQLASRLNTRLFETSAKENLGVEEMFQAVAEILLRAKRDYADGIALHQSHRGGFKLKSKSGETSKKRSSYC